jgi:hypothetical protein
MNGLLATTREKFSFSDRLRRNRHSNRIRTKALPKRQDFLLEPLESRLLLSVTLVGVPDWQEQGPGPVSPASFGVQGEQAGAINGIAADPADPDRLFVATANGGVWRTTNATASSPTWTPLTDQLPSLSMGAIAFSPLDSNTLFAGEARLSSGGRDGGPLNGILKTTDGGSTWLPIGQTTLGGLNITRIVPTAIGTPATQIVLAATTGTNGGLFRSTDGGGSWTPISNDFNLSDGLGTGLPPGNINDLDADPGNTGNINTDRFYASVPGQGIFRSTDGGTTWTGVNSNINTLSPGLIAGSVFIDLAIHNSAGANAVYASILPPQPAAPAAPIPPSIFRSTDQGGTWTAMDNPPDVPRITGMNGLAADPTSPTVVFIAGAQGDGFGFGNHGHIFRGDASQPLGSQWTPVTGDPPPAGAGGGFGANGTAPHPDQRDMVFDANGDLLDSNDGGLYRLVHPNNDDATRQWVSVNGNIRPTEFYSVAYDNLNNTIFGGTQDNGTPRQRATTDPAYPFGWPEAEDCDGGVVAVDNDQTAHPGTTIQYTSGQNLFSCGFVQRTVDSTNMEISAVDVGVVVDGSTIGGMVPPNTLGPVEKANPGGSTIAFIQPYVLNAAAPTRMLIGTAFLYESTNQGFNLTSLGGLTDLNSDGLNNDNDFSDPPMNTMPLIDEGDEFRPTTPVGNLNADGFDNDNDGTIDEGDEFARVTAMAYGGRLNGTDVPDVAYVGKTGGVLNGVTGTLSLRTANTTNTLADFTTLTNYPGSAPRDIVLDPDDWQRGYVVDRNSRVFRFINAGAAVSDWTNITGNLNPPPGSANPPLSADLRTIEVFSPTSTPGDEVVLMGGVGGVFRTLDPFDGPNATWTEFGGGLPNAITKDLHYDPTDDVLLAGTYGRGAWTISSASTSLLAPGVLQIDGDTDFAGEDDVIRLIRETANPSLLDVFLNSATPTLTVQLSVLQQINVNGLGGNDTLIVDSSNGLINVPLGVRYDGGTGIGDQLQLLQSDGPTRTSDTYSVGPVIGSGTSTIVGPGTAGTQTVSFENLSPVLDLVPAALLTVNATATDNAINYSAGLLLTNGLVTIDEHESITFANKTTLTINAGAGQDTVSVNNPNTPTGLTGITINGGAPSSGDALIATGVGGAVTVNTATSTITGATGAGGAVSIGYGGIETLDLPAGIGNLTLTTTTADDTVVVTPGQSTGANSGTVQSSGAVPQIVFANSGTFTANLDDGDDALVVNGSSDADTVAVSGAAVAISGRRTVNYTGVQALTVNGNAGSDTFNVTPSPTVAMFIDGGDPIGAKPGDLLNIIAGVDPVTFNAGPETDEGGFVVGANQPVSFDHIESLAITGGGPAVINGTNGPDAITVIARDASTHPGTDGEQDFTVSVNTGPELLFVNVASLAVNALSGSDQVTLQTPAPNNAEWGVAVSVDGGLPAADTDRLIVQTPGAAAETVVYTPSASDGGTLELATLSSPVTITGIEGLSYDGQGDKDNLTIVGTGGADTIVHTPGATNQAGSFQVNSLLALGYQNLGTGASLTADGVGGMDTLVYNGTAANDAFTIGSLGEVTLNSRLTVNTANVEALTLEGFDGDDTFTLVPPISASVYPTINLNGGGQASATGDRVFLAGTTGDDDIAISGQVVSLGGVTINSSGIEAISLNANGGNDLITYNGVIGVTENITVSSSGVMGGGQIRVPDVTLVNFSGVESIDVNGNEPTPTETDTLTFAGTDDPDRFEIDLAAEGTTGDPILELFKNGSQPLLTLRSYTNFDTLRVLGLNGADTFNVITADPDPTPGPDRNLFVDGGAPTGKKKATDNLFIFYTPSRPTIIQSAATQDPDAGIVTLEYDTARFVVQYDDVEQVPPPKKQP